MSDRLLVGTRKGLFTMERGASGGPDRWRVTDSALLGDSVSIVYVDERDGTVYAAVNLGHYGVKLHRSPDGRSDWAECATPKYPSPPEGAEPDRCPMAGIEIPWNTELIWSIAAGGADQPGVLWCGTMPGGLFRSEDRGTSWEMVRSLWDQPARKKWFGGGLDYPAIHSICVDPRDAQRVAVAISCGGVWVTMDGGATWKCHADGMRAEYMPPDQSNDPDIQDPHCMVQCAADPDTLWVQHHNGVFRSTDGAKSWSEITTIEPSTFGFAVAVHPADPQTAWFIPAIKDELRIPVDGRVVVARTRDGGRSCDVLRDGLPQTHAYDLTFRHALDVDETGDRLCFGSTTGSVWMSENQGDKWACVTTHLPPVHCITFAPTVA